VVVVSSGFLHTDWLCLHRNISSSEHGTSCIVKPQRACSVRHYQTLCPELMSTLLAQPITRLRVRMVGKLGIRELHSIGM
jgi:hypothetical protein